MIQADQIFSKLKTTVCSNTLRYNAIYVATVRGLRAHNNNLSNLFVRFFRAIFSERDVTVILLERTT